MIVHGCIGTHPKDYGGWIIVTGFRVLLISQHLFPEILLEAVYPCRKCQNKKYLHSYVATMHLLYKGFVENYQCWYAYEKVFISKRRMGERWLCQLLVLATCMKRQMTTLILTGIWLWMQ